MKTFTFFYLFIALVMTGTLHAQSCASYVQPPNDLVQDGAMDYYGWPNCSTARLTVAGGAWNFPYYCCYWTTPSSTGTTYCTPDFFHTCVPAPTNSSAPNNTNAGESVNAGINWQNFAPGTPPTAFTPGGPHSGNGYSGIAVWNSGNESREYVTNQLVSTLQPGWTYKIGMWVKLSGNSAYGIQNLSVLFSNTLPLQNFSGSVMTNLSPLPGELLVPLSGSVITDKNNWTYLTTNVLMPSGSGYNFITIGNFNNKNSTIISQELNIGATTMGLQSYYYIDDVSLVVENCAPYLDLQSSTHEICKGDQGSLNVQYPATGSFNIVVLDLSNNTVVYNGPATPNIPVSPSVTTTYQVTITDLNTPTCVSSSNFTITVLPEPDATFTPGFVNGGIQLQGTGAGTHTWEVWGSFTGNQGTYTYIGTYEYPDFVLNTGVPCLFIRHTVTNDCGTDCKAMAVCNYDCSWEPCGLQEPTNLQYDAATQQFSWDPVPGADHYVVEIILNASFCCGDGEFGGVSVSHVRSITSYTNTLTIDLTQDVGPADISPLFMCFAWRVLAVCENGASAVSPFKCEGSSGDGMHEGLRYQPGDKGQKSSPNSSTTARIFPNPANGVTNIEIQADRDMEFDIHIYDMTGRLVKTFAHIKNTGKQTLVTWNTEGYSKGAYQVSITTSDHQMINQTLVLE